MRFFGGEVEAVEVFEADAGGDGFDGLKIVAGDDFDVDVVIIEVIDDFFGVTTDFVFETDVAE